MRTYGKIESAFWQNPKVRKLTEDGRLLLLYIYTTPHGNSIGAFILPVGYIAEDVNWESERVTQTLSELIVNGFIERDFTNNLTRIIDWFEHNDIENQNVGKAALKSFNILPNGEIKDSVLSDLAALDKPFMEPLLEPYRNGIPNPEPSQSLARALTKPKPEPKGGGIRDPKAADNPAPSGKPQGAVPSAPSEGLNLNDFANACAVLACLLGWHKLTQKDQEIVGVWVCQYDIRNEVLPLVETKLKAFVAKEGKVPSSLAYFNKALAESVPSVASELGRRLRTA